MSGWKPDVPVELEDGTLVCQKHGFIICGKCICDYSFVAEMKSDGSEGDLDDESSDYNAKDDYRTRTY